MVNFWTETWPSRKESPNFWLSLPGGLGDFGGLTLKRAHLISILQSISDFYLGVGQEHTPGNNSDHGGRNVLRLRKYAASGKAANVIGPLGKHSVLEDASTASDTT